jgi:hypothetical protein
MQDGCKSDMDSFLHGIQWIVFHGHLDYFQKPPLGGRPDTKPGDHGKMNAMVTALGSCVKWPLNYMPKGLKVLCSLIANMIPFVNISNFFRLAGVSRYAL